jgi:hypothetical protein
VAERRQYPTVAWKGKQADPLFAYRFSKQAQRFVTPAFRQLVHTGVAEYALEGAQLPEGKWDTFGNFDDEGMRIFHCETISIAVQALVGVLQSENSPVAAGDASKPVLELLLWNTDNTGVRLFETAVSAIGLTSIGFLHDEVVDVSGDSFVCIPIASSGALQLF